MVVLCLQTGNALASDTEVIIQADASHVITLDSIENGADGLVLTGKVTRRHFAQRSRPFGSVVLNVVDADGVVQATSEAGIHPKLISRHNGSEFQVSCNAEIPSGSHFEVAFVR